MEFVYFSDTGKVRSDNQDSCSVFSVGKCVFAAVADGMGGYNGGKEASKLAVSVFEKTMLSSFKEDMTAEEIKKLLLAAFAEANEAVLSHAKAHEEYRGMGTTLVCAVICRDMLYIANTGDSRAYVIREKAEQITKDQSYVQMLVDRGEITKRQAMTHPKKNIILSAIGDEKFSEPDFYISDYFGEYVLLCSDGLTNEVDDAALYKIMAGEENLKDKVRKLAEKANKNGGADNITVAVIKGEKNQGGDLR